MRNHCALCHGYPSSSPVPCVSVLNVMCQGEAADFSGVDRRGFTLLEVLLSLVLLSVVLGALYSSFFLSHRAMDGLDNAVIKLREGRMIMDTLSREVDSAVFSPGNKAAVFRVEDRDIYGKQASRFTFTAVSPLNPGLSVISYYVEEKEGVMKVFKKVGSAYSDSIPDKGVELAEDIDAFLVEVRDKGDWLRTWDAAQVAGMPGEVRVTITVKMKDRPVTFYEEIRPKIGRRI